MGIIENIAVILLSVLVPLWGVEEPETASPITSLIGDFEGISFSDVKLSEGTFDYGLGLNKPYPGTPETDDEKCEMACRKRNPGGCVYYDSTAERKSNGGLHCTCTFICMPGLKHYR